MPAKSMINKLRVLLDILPVLSLINVNVNQLYFSPIIKVDEITKLTLCIDTGVRIVPNVVYKKLE